MSCHSCVVPDAPLDLESCAEMDVDARIYTPWICALNCSFGAFDWISGLGYQFLVFPEGWVSAGREHGAFSLLVCCVGWRVK